MNPQTRQLMSDPEFQAILKEVQADPMQSMQKHMTNPKFQQAMSVGLSAHGPPILLSPAYGILSENSSANYCGDVAYYIRHTLKELVKCTYSP